MHISKCILLKNMIEEDDPVGPRDYKYTSTVYVLNQQKCSMALHIVPEGLRKETLDLGTITRIVHYSLDTSIPEENVYMMVHFVPDEKAVHVTMLPVGCPEAREETDKKMKSDQGFSGLIAECMELCASEEPIDSVRIMYDSPADVNRENADIAVVTEMGTNVDSEIVKQFCLSVGR